MNSYKTYLVVLLASAAGSCFLTPFAKWLAMRWGAVDQPGPRKIHSAPMPRLGGIAVFIGFCLPWGGLYFLHNRISVTFQDYEKLFLALMLGASAMLALGIYDDIKGADAVKKFLVQIGVAIGLWFAGYRIAEFRNPFGGDLQLAVWISLPITVLWIVGVTNAINLLDGIDGLVSGVTVVISLSLASINVMAGNVLLALLTLALAGACVGFLPHNYSPARIFLGDSGSLTIGVVLAGIGILSFFTDNGKAASPLITVPLILFGLPLFDTARVIVKRLMSGAPLFQADKNHVHHRLLALGLTQKQAALTLYAVAALTGSLAVMLSAMPSGRQLLLSALFALLGVITYFIWKFSLRAMVEDDSRPPR